VRFSEERGGENRPRDPSPSGASEQESKRYAA
jgi:hypothetical protein